MDTVAHPSALTEAIVKTIKILPVFISVCKPYFGIVFNSVIVVEANQIVHGMDVFL